MGQPSSLPAETLAYEQMQKDETARAFLLLLHTTFGKAVVLPPIIPFSKNTLPWLMDEIIKGKQYLDEKGEVHSSGFMISSLSSADHSIRVAKKANGILITVYLTDTDQVEMDEYGKLIDFTLPWA